MGTPGYCCHCGAKVTLGAPHHGRSNRFAAVGHKCPRLSKRDWYGRRYWPTAIGMIDDPFPPPEVRTKRFKRPDKSLRQQYAFARSSKRSWKRTRD